jgi:hypothetical protein
LGCKKFIDVNSNPNNATSSSSGFLFAGALNRTYQIQVAAVVNAVPGAWTGYYGLSNSYTGGANIKTYEFGPQDFNAFDGMYDNLNDYNTILQNADNDGVGLWKHPATVMMCYVFQQLVDFYGDIPYTEAFQKVNNILPKYDDQQSIYEDLIVRLDSSINAMVAAPTWPTATEIINQDIYFKGNKDSWIRFANTLKLRILMRQSFMSGRDTYIKDNINSTLSRGYITANVLCNPGYQAVAGKLNPYYSTYGFNEQNTITTNHQYYKMGAPIINWLKTGVTTGLSAPSASPSATANADTFRLQSLAWPNGTTVTAPNDNLNTYSGIPLGIGSGYATAGASPQGPIQIQQGQGSRAAMLMLLAESYFLRAEAAERYAIAFPGFASAQALYEAGILAHFRTCAAPSTAGNAANTGDAFAQRYIARAVNNQGWAVSTDKIKAILIQKWVSLCNINGLEAWSEYRKSSGSTSVGIPVSPKTVAATSNSEPVRFLYPQSEFNVNNANVPQGIDRFTSKIFWDKN